jgi:hypothetical protein
MTVNKERLEVWINALESDEFEQVKEAYFGDRTNEACALGVGLITRERILSVEKDSSNLPTVLRVIGLLRFYGISDKDAGPIISLNDDDGASFWEIAQFLREKYLKEEA